MIICIFLAILAGPGIVYGADPGKPDIISMDSVAVKVGKPAELAIRIQADDTTDYNGTSWVGVGSFCLPIKYDCNVIKLDSVKFIGALKDWDAKFTNPKIDTGFISFAGIYNTGGSENPSLHSPGKPEEIIRIYLQVAKGAKPGMYPFELTIDPIQNELYVGSVDGFHSWRPEFKPGKIVVTK